MDAIAKTSLLTAAMRAFESKLSESEGRFFLDPYAESLAGSEGIALAKKAIAEVGDQPAIAVRTKYMDEKILKAVNGNIRQIVMLAAGMDTRAYRLKLPDRVRIIELDRKEVLDYKRAKLGQAQPFCERIDIAVDLTGQWQDMLLQSGFNQNEQTLWLVEGLLMYLEETDVVSLFEKINKLAKTQDILLCDILGRSLLEAPFMKKQLEFLASFGAPWRFGENEPEKFLEKFGWSATATQPGEFAPTRWPFPPAPRHVPNVPRSFFIEAHKI